MSAPAAELPVTVSPLSPGPTVAALLADAQPGQTATVRGWVRTRRDSKAGLSFVELNDGSCLSNLQLVLPHDLPEFDSRAAPITTGASLVARGEIVESQGRNQRIELRVADFVVPGAADPDRYPLQKKRHSFEYLREIAHLRPRSNTFGAVARVRNRLSHAVHEFFQDRGFLYAHTPIITTNDCEGAGEVFTVTALAAAKLAEAAAGGDFSGDFFGKHAGLTVSGQLEGEVYATSLGPTYTFGPTFRAENSNTPRHLAEFWMIEPEVPFCDLDGDMDLAEAFVKSTLAAVREDCAEDLEFFAQRIDKTLPETLDAVANQEFVRLPYTEAIDLLKSSGQKFEYPVEWGHDLQTEHERFLTETHFKRPVIVHDYPASIKPFYMRVNEPDEQGRETVRAMDVLAPRVGEIVGGSQREEREDVLVERMKGQGIDPASLWWYVELRTYGSVPHAGFGLGLERLVQLVTGMQNVRDVIPFPRTPGHAEF
ncbi:asparagine--tRNA ligase [Alienimonas sp. DA493]|uniref:asparagine--tRNA ligase n=1 Tax=Alienimonas sp. DA493 TaxID=3373605 RepID=UPI0037547CF5